MSEEIILKQLLIGLKCVYLILFQGTTIFEIKVRDGDTGIPRKLDLSIVGDTENFFELENLGHSEDGILSASLKKTSGNTLDRELPVRNSYKNKDIYFAILI